MNERPGQCGAERTVIAMDLTERTLESHSIFEGKIVTLLVSPGFCNERLHLYLARGLSRADSHPDDDEFLNVVTMPFDQLLEQVMDGSIEDAKTVAGVLKTKVLLNL